jgi:hypothetical protein
MSLKRRFTAVAAATAALGVGAPAGLATATSPPVTDAVITGPSCPDGYAGPTNLATGCPWWIMSYTVQSPGHKPRRMPPGWTPPAPA